MRGRADRRVGGSSGPQRSCRSGKHSNGSPRRRDLSADALNRRTPGHALLASGRSEACLDPETAAPPALSACAERWDAAKSVRLSGHPRSTYWSPYGPSNRLPSMTSTVGRIEALLRALCRRSHPTRITSPLGGCVAPKCRSGVIRNACTECPSTWRARATGTAHLPVRRAVVGAVPRGGRIATRRCRLRRGSAHRRRQR